MLGIWLGVCITDQMSDRIETWFISKVTWRLEERTDERLTPYDWA